MEDQEAIRRLKNGDIGGLEWLITRYQLKAVRAAFFIVQDQPTAEDVVQDVFLRIFERIRNFDETRPFEPYLLRSVVNLALTTAQRRERYNPPPDDGSWDSLENLFASAASVEDEVEEREIHRSILNAIARLPSRARAAVVLRYYLEMSEKEMAGALGAAPGTVKSLLNSARTRLRGLIRAERSDL